MRLAVWGSLFLPLLAGLAQAEEPRNVVLIVADDHGLQAGCYGNRIVKTPHLDALAEEGTRFTHAFCTTSSCSASRSVILTGLQNHANGQYGHQHGKHNFHTHRFVRGLPVLLSRGGYRTCSIGKYHLQPESIYHFDEYVNQQIMGSRHSLRMANNARQFIERVGDRPFFLYFCPGDPHRSEKGFGNQVNYPGLREVTYPPEKIDVPPLLPDTPEVRRELAEYYQAISRMDRGVGHLVNALKNTGHWDDTLIIYLSDNGMPFPGAKTNLYDAGMHLPLIVRSPDQKKRGGTCNAMVSWVDIVPTILEFTDVKGPVYPLHGRSFLPILSHSDPEGWKEVYASHTFHEVTMYYPMRAIRTRRYKYILNLAHPLPFPFASDLFDSATWQGVLKRELKTCGKRPVEDYLHRPRHELYDLQEDPLELHNLAKDPEHAERLEELQGKLKAWQKATDDPWVVKYRHE